MKSCVAPVVNFQYQFRNTRIWDFFTLGPKVRELFSSSPTQLLAVLFLTTHKLESGLWALRRRRSAKLTQRPGHSTVN